VYGDDEEESSNDEKGKAKQLEKEPESQLAQPLQAFVKLVFNSE
jgi:hypothetical protein